MIYTFLVAQGSTRLSTLSSPRTVSFYATSKAQAMAMLAGLPAALVSRLPAREV